MVLKHPWLRSFASFKTGDWDSGRENGSDHSNCVLKPGSSTVEHVLLKQGTLITNVVFCHLCWHNSISSRFGPVYIKLYIEMQLWQIYTSWTTPSPNRKFGYWSDYFFFVGQILSYWNFRRMFAFVLKRSILFHKLHFCYRTSGATFGCGEWTYQTGQFVFVQRCHDIAVLQKQENLLLVLQLLRISQGCWRSYPSSFGLRKRSNRYVSAKFRRRPNWCLPCLKNVCCRSGGKSHSCSSSFTGCSR